MPVVLADPARDLPGAQPGDRLDADGLATVVLLVAERDGAGGRQADDRAREHEEQPPCARRARRRGARAARLARGG